MELTINKRHTIFCALFFIIMAGYALLRELRDSVFIQLVGLSYLPKVKLFSLLFLFFELLVYQKLIDLLNPKNTYILFSAFYGLLLFVFAAIFFYIPESIPSSFGYIFYVALEGYPPFIWSLLWAIFTSENSPDSIKNNYMSASLFAQIGGFLFSFGLYYLIKKKIFLNINFLFSFIMILSSILLIFSIGLMYYLKYNQLIFIENQLDDGDKNISLINSNYKNKIFNVFATWYYSFKKIIQSWYVIGIFLIVFCWEVINIVLNYFRLDVLLEKTTSESIFLLQDLYYSISLSYFLGIFVVLIGSSFLVRWYGVRKTLIAFPILIAISIMPFLLFGQRDFLVVMYMIIKAFYPALIFPIKESLYLVTSEEIRYKSKSWIDGLGSRFSKTFAAFYIQISLLFLSENRYIIHISFFSFLLLLFIFIVNYVTKIWEEKVITNKKIE